MDGGPGDTTLDTEAQLGDGRWALPDNWAEVGGWAQRAPPLPPSAPGGDLGSLVQPGGVNTRRAAPGPRPR
jgi:hypothetical protein